MKPWALVLFFAQAVVPMCGSPLHAETTSCFYKDNRGVIKVADELVKIPVEYQASASCATKKGQAPARPSEIELTGNVRSVSMASPVGRIDMRWPRALEKLFGRTPERALADAARTASRALKSGGFPSHVSTADLSWRIVFLDQNLPEKQIPMQLVSQCHPGWMYPPADIFIVGQRIVAGCSNATPLDGKNADKALTRVLLHEMGHAIEFALLRGKAQNDHFRAEGFASWFESYAAQFSSLVDEESVAMDYGTLGGAALTRGMTGFSFTGSPLDYGLSFLTMRYVVEKRGVPGLMRLYAGRLSSGEMFNQAVRKELSIKPEKLHQNLTELAMRLSVSAPR